MQGWKKKVHVLGRKNNLLTNMRLIVLNVALMAGRGARCKKLKTHCFVSLFLIACDERDRCICHIVFTLLNPWGHETLKGAYRVELSIQVILWVLAYGGGEEIGRFWEMVEVSKLLKIDSKEKGGTWN